MDVRWAGKKVALWAEWKAVLMAPQMGEKLVGREAELMADRMVAYLAEQTVVHLEPMSAARKADGWVATKAALTESLKAGSWVADLVGRSAVRWVCCLVASSADPMVEKSVAETVGNWADT